MSVNGTISLGNRKLLGLADGVGNTDGVSKLQVENLISAGIVTATQR